MNYFNLFDLPQKFELEINNLTSKFYALQKKFHPDVHQQEKSKKHLLHLKKSILLNQGYQILKNPLKRAEYLLFLNHIQINKEKEIVFKLQFLKKQLKLYEQIEKLKTVTKKDQSNKVYLQIKNEEQHYFKKLQLLLNKKQWHLAKIILCKLLFFEKLKKKIANLKNILFIH